MPNPYQLPFKEAIEFFRNKVALPTQSWTDIWEAQHAKAFVVAGAVKDELLSDIFTALKQAQSEGTQLKDFGEKFDEIAERHKWNYRGSRDFRVKTIFHTNMRQSYNAGRWQQLQASKKYRPYLMYIHSDASRTPRLQHKAWHSLVLHIDDPWWQSHYPQNGWGCNCSVRSYSARDLERRGLKVDDAPITEFEEKVVGITGPNPRTVKTPKGIDPGFGHNIGENSLKPHIIPPLDEYQAVKELQIKPIERPSMPKPTIVPAGLRLEEGLPPENYVSQFLAQFGADRGKPALFQDATGTPLVIGEELFQNGKGQWKWDVSKKGKKQDRLQDVLFLAMTLLDPDEIWYVWQPYKREQSWGLKRKYIKVFEVEGTGEFGFAAFEWTKYGWSGSTTFMPDQATVEARERYINSGRVGKLVYKKEVK